MGKIVDVPGHGPVEFPDSMDDAAIVAAIKKNPAPASKPRDVTQDMSRTEKFMAGAGKAVVDTARGAGQAAREWMDTLVTPQNLTHMITGGKTPTMADTMKLPTRADIDESKKIDANLMNDGWGMAGNVTGNVAMALPLARIKGASTVPGGGLIGALQGAMQPVGTDDSRSLNTVIGGAAGAAVPAAIRAAKVLRAGLVDPFTTDGRTKIAASVIKRAAADPAAVADKLRTARGATPGFNLTAGQAADDAGVGALERTVRATDPAGFDAVDKSQRGALVDALRGIAKTPEDRAAAVAAVEKQSKNLYGEAFKENVDVTPTLTRLAARPSMAKAESRAMGLADEMGIPYQARLKDMRPQYVPVKEHINPSSVEAFEEIPSKLIPLGQRQLPDARVLPKRAPMDYTQQVDRVIPIGKSAPEYFEVPGQRIAKTLTISPEPRPPTMLEIPPVDSVPVRDMHTLKMGMDALLSDPTSGIAKREAAAVMATRNKLLDQLPESYQQARLGHIEMNKPVNQMDIGTELYNRFTPALADQGGTPFKSTASAYANALRNGDKLAANVTGLKSAKLESIMEPAQMDVLHGIAKDSATQAAAESIGKGAGSDTVQKISMSNLAAEAGIPNWMASVARVPGGWAKRAGDVVYGSSDEQIRGRLSELLRNPEEAAKAMAAAGASPSKIAQFLRMGAQSQVLALPASANALEK